MQSGKGDKRKRRGGVRVEQDEKPTQSSFSVCGFSSRQADRQAAMDVLACLRYSCAVLLLSSRVVLVWGSGAV